MPSTFLTTHGTPFCLLTLPPCSTHTNTHTHTHPPNTGPALATCQIWQYHRTQVVPLHKGHQKAGPITSHIQTKVIETFGLGYIALETPSTSHQCQKSCMFRICAEPVFRPKLPEISKKSMLPVSFTLAKSIMSARGVNMLLRMFNVLFTISFDHEFFIFHVFTMSTKHA